MELATLELMLLNAESSPEATFFIPTVAESNQGNDESIFS
jgi:hypothetical protein